MKLIHTDRSITIGDQSWPAIIKIEDRESLGYLRRRRQALLHFENGWVLSIIWGDNAYGSNYEVWVEEDHVFEEEPTHVEIGAWNNRLNAELMEWPDEGNKVTGNVPVEKLPMYIDMVSRFRSDLNSTGVIDLRQGNP